MTDQGNPNLQEDPLGGINNTSTPSQPLQTEQVASQYNMKSPAVKRILREAAEMAREDKTILTAGPLEDNIFEWHFTLRGPPDTPYELGMYHGRIILPSQYPMSPPHIMLLTPNGRFETGTKICLSISNYHPETWQPSWSIGTALVALRSFMATDSPGAIGSLECSEAVRKTMAINSRRFECSDCGFLCNILSQTEYDRKLEAAIPILPEEAKKKMNAKEKDSSLSDDLSSSEASQIPVSESLITPVLAKEDINNDSKPGVDESDRAVSKGDLIPTHLNIRSEGNGLQTDNRSFGSQLVPQSFSDWAIGFILILICGIIFRRMLNA